MFLAVDGEDYRAVTHEIIFNNATDREQRVYVPLFNDACVEYDEYFSVDLTTSMDCIELDVNSVNITIMDDDRKLILACSQYYYNIKQ